MLIFINMDHALQAAVKSSYWLWQKWERAQTFVLKNNYLKDFKAMWALQCFSPIHSTSVNSFSNVFLFFFCSLLYL